MKTITVQIGNSDDKLTQKEWNSFVQFTHIEILKLIVDNGMHFCAGSPSSAVWQNYCFVFNIESINIPHLKECLKDMAKRFKQNSIAWTEGDTEFLSTV